MFLACLSNVFKTFFLEICIIWVLLSGKLYYVTNSLLINDVYLGIKFFFLISNMTELQYLLNKRNIFFDVQIQNLCAWHNVS